LPANCSNGCECAAVEINFDYSAESGKSLPHSKTWPTFAAHSALAFWSAAIIRRFEILAAAATSPFETEKH